jgi:CheY-like chemotaxis protein
MRLNCGVDSKFNEDTSALKKNAFILKETKESHSSMVSKQFPATILVAEDDEDDRLLLEEAFREAQVLDIFYFVKDGDELMDYLCQRNKYAEPNAVSLPELVILDLNMPKKDGREVLKEIKSNPLTRHIPVVVLTTSNYIEDVQLAYNLGANSFIVKPLRFDALVHVIKTLVAYWFGVVRLPTKQLD